MAHVWPLQLRPTSKAVLISLADQANDDGVCWPSVRTMITRTCLSERAVQGAIKELVELGHLEAKERSGRSTVYRVVHIPPQEVHPRKPDTPARAAPPPPQDVHPTPAAGAPHPRTTCTQNRKGTVKEPSVEPPSASTAAGEGATPPPVDKSKRAAPAEKARKNLPERAEGMATWEPSPPCRKWVTDHGYEPFYALHLETFRAYMLQTRNFKRYVDGDAAFRTCVLSDWGHVRSQAMRNRPPGSRPLAIEPGDRWWRTTDGIKAKGVQLKVEWKGGEFWRYEERVFAAAGEGPWLDPTNMSDSRIARVRELMAENAREKSDEAA
jgi:hypothetical protein